MSSCTNAERPHFLDPISCSNMKNSISGFNFSYKNIVVQRCILFSNFPFFYNSWRIMCKIVRFKENIVHFEYLKYKYIIYYIHYFIYGQLLSYNKQ